MNTVIKINCLAVLSTIFCMGNSLHAQSALTWTHDKIKESWNKADEPANIASMNMDDVYDRYDPDYDNEEDYFEEGEIAYEEPSSKEVAVRGEEDSFSSPKPAFLKQENKVVLENTAAIVLVGKEAALHQRGYKHLEGVYVYEVDPPGSEKKLAAKLEPFLGKPLTLFDITAIKKTIISYYKSYGRPMVAIQVPEQDVTEGVVQFLITEGVLGKVESKGNKWFSDARLKNFIKLKPGKPINEDKLVKNLDFMNRNPFRRTDAVYTPGEKPGTTDVELITKDRFPLRVYTGVDNTGLERTGKNRVFAGFNWGDAFGLDQQLSYQYTASTDFYKFQAHTANYSIPLPWQHTLTFYGGYSNIHADLPHPAKRTHGNSYEASMRYNITLSPVGKYLHEFIWGGDFKRTNTNLEFEEQVFIPFHPYTNLTQFAFGYNGGLELSRSKTSFDAEVYYSPGGWVADQSKKVYDETRPGAKPTYAYFRGSVVYIQYLPMNFSVSGLFRGQIATTNLLPSEQFGLGGYNTVRGYEERQVNTDNAILTSVEVRSPMIGLLQMIGTHKIKDGLQFLAFFDYGLGKDYARKGDISTHQWLMGVGPGLRYYIDPYLTVRLDYGFKLHRDHYEGNKNGRLHFSVIASY